MTIFNRFRLLLASKGEKIFLELTKVLARTTKEISNCDKSIKSLIINWLVSIPLAYFKTLFVEEEHWLNNKKLINILNNSEITDINYCATVIQAFFMTYLERLISNDISYNKYSIDKINIAIKEKLYRGNDIKKLAFLFNNDFKKLPQNEWQTMLLIEICKAFYDDNEKITTIINNLLHDSRLHLATETYLVELLKQAKENDKIFGAI